MLEHKPLKILAKRMFPRFVSEDYPQMITFMEKVFDYMQVEGGQYDIIANLLEYTDVDNTLDKFEEVFVDQYLKNFPSALASDVAHLVKNIRSFYLNKGTEQSYRFLFAALYNSPVNFKYPKFNILRASDGLYFTPTYLVLTDANDNIPPQTSGGDDYDISKLIGQFVTGSDSGAVAFIEDVVTLGDHGLHWAGDTTVRAASIVEKEGTFSAGEQILLGDTLFQNGDFSLGLSSWQIFPALDTGITVINNELNIAQVLGDVVDKYAYQEVAIEENTQYWLRYSLLSADQPETKVTVGYSPGTNEIYDSGNLGTSAVTNTVLMNATAAGKTSVFVSVWSEMDIGTETAIYDGFSLVKENTSNVPLMYISALECQEFTDLSFLDTDPDTITTIIGDFTSYIEVNDLLFVSGSASNDGAYVVEAVTATTLTVSSDPENVIYNFDNVVESLNNVVTALFDSLTAEGSNDVTATLCVVDSGILEGPSQWKDNRGMLSEGDFDGDQEIVLQDNDYYQDYSYELQSEVSSADFEQVVRDLVHPSGFKLFAKVISGDVSQTYVLRRSIYDDLVFDDGAGTITRTASGRPFDDVWRIGDIITVYNADPEDTSTLDNYGQFTVTAISATVITVSQTLIAETPTQDVSIAAGMGIIPLAAGEDVSFLYDMFFVIGLDVVDSASLISYEIDYEFQYGFGNTYAQEERNRESKSIVISDWENIVIGDFDTYATQRFLFILPIEVDITAAPAFAGTNLFTSSWDLTDAAWTVYGSSFTRALDEDGVDGTSNKATTLTDGNTATTVASGVYQYLENIDVSTTGWATLRMFIKKDATATQGTIFYLPFISDDYNDWAEFDFIFSPDSGDYYTDVYDGTIDVLVRTSDYDTDWWEILAEFNFGSTDTDARFEGEFGPAFIDPYEVAPALPQSAGGEIIVGNVEIFAETRIADIPAGTGPIYTP